MSLNDNDVIVASGVWSKGSGDRAIVWRNDTSMDLNKLIRGSTDWVLQEATSVNNKGQIVGIGHFQNTTHAFLLTPFTK